MFVNCSFGLFFTILLSKKGGTERTELFGTRAGEGRRLEDFPSFYNFLKKHKSASRSLQSILRDAKIPFTLPDVLGFL